MPNRKPVSLAEGEKIFNDYYKKKHKKKPLSHYRARLFDKLYTKKSKNRLQPGSKESYKYRLQEGVKTYDLDGVDAYNEGESFTITHDVTGEVQKKVSKGISKRKNGVTYKQNFGDNYTENYGDKDIDLVNSYWDKFKKRELLEERLRSYGTLSDDEINETLDILSNEILGFKKYSYKDGKKNKKMVRLHNNDIIMLNRDILLQLKIKPNVIDILMKEIVRANNLIEQEQLVGPRKNKNYSSKLKKILKSQLGKTQSQPQPQPQPTPNLKDENQEQEEEQGEEQGEEQDEEEQEEQEEQEESGNIEDKELNDILIKIDDKYYIKKTNDDDDDDDDDEDSENTEDDEDEDDGTDYIKDIFFIVDNNNPVLHIFNDINITNKEIMFKKKKVYDFTNPDLDSIDAEKESTKINSILETAIEEFNLLDYNDDYYILSDFTKKVFTYLSKQNKTPQEKPQKESEEISQESSQESSQEDTRDDDSDILSDDEGVDLGDVSSDEDELINTDSDSRSEITDGDDDMDEEDEEVEDKEVEDKEDEEEDGANPYPAIIGLYKEDKKEIDSEKVSVAEEETNDEEESVAEEETDGEEESVAEEETDGEEDIGDEGDTEEDEELSSDEDEDMLDDDDLVLNGGSLHTLKYAKKNIKKYKLSGKMYNFHVGTKKQSGGFSVYAGRNILGYSKNDIIGKWTNKKPDKKAKQFANNVINLLR